MLYANSVKRQFSVGVSVDLSKAFDTLYHNSLLAKLNYYGIRGSSPLFLCIRVANWLLRHVCSQFDITVFAL